MFDEFIFDLKVARKKSGLSQADCGHLIGGTNHKISQLELGAQMPTIREICSLSLIYGRSFESLWGEMLAQVRRDLGTNLETLPGRTSDRPEHFNRTKSLERLAQRLLEEQSSAYGT